MTIAESCLQGSIRLVGPSGPNTVEGRVEYCSNGLWGTISSSWFDTRDGEVVCRQLGHQHPRELAKNKFMCCTCTMNVMSLFVCKMFIV